jgi:hypothetical protein
MSLPSYSFFPAPLWMLTALHVLTLSLHLVAMNFMVGGTLIVLAGRFPDRWHDPTVRRVVKLLPSAMAATVSLGVAPLLFLQVVYPRQVYAAAIVSAWFWLLIVAAVIVSYYLLYLASFSTGPAKRRAWYLGIALAGMVYVAFVYSSVFSMAEQPALSAELYRENQSGLVLNPAIGSYLFWWLHMVLGAVTVGGFFVAWLGSDNDNALNVGKAFYLWGMIAASLAGIGWLFTLGDAIVPLMKGPAIWVLFIAIVLAFAAYPFFHKGRFVVAAGLLFCSLLGMVTTRHVVRLIHLRGSYDPATITIIPQWSVFILFLICLVLALLAIGYMVRLFFAGVRSAGQA